MLRERSQVRLELFQRAARALRQALPARTGGGRPKQIQGQRWGPETLDNGLFPREYRPAKSVGELWWYANPASHSELQAHRPGQQRWFTEISSSETEPMTCVSERMDCTRGRTWSLGGGGCVS